MQHNALIRFLRRLSRNQSGQGMTEYIIIVALVAILSIGVISFFGDNIRSLFNGASTALSGKDVSGDLVKDANRRTEKGLKDLKDYNKAP